MWSLPQSAGRLDIQERRRCTADFGDLFTFSSTVGVRTSENECRVEDLVGCRTALTLRAPDGVNSVRFLNHAAFCDTRSQAPAYSRLGT